ncbi:hypothetical protein VTH06DRAFT_1014 [Thermothelomyces fergusii]
MCYGDLVDSIITAKAVKKIKARV